MRTVQHVARWAFVVVILAPSVAVAGQEVTLPGVCAASWDQPELYGLIKDGNDILPFGAEENAAEFFVDTGASGIVVSKVIVDLFGIGWADFEGYYTETGIAGLEIGDVTRPFTIKLINGSLWTVPPEVPESDFDDYGEFNLWARRIIDELEEWDPVNIVGMPIISQCVMDIDPTPIAELDRLRTYLLPHGDPNIPTDRLNAHVALRLINFLPDEPPPGETFPSSADNPVIPNIVVRYGGNSSAGTWLLDTGASASFISIAQANAIGLTQYTNLDDILNANDFDFSTEVGGIGGTAVVPGYLVDQVRVPTMEGFELVFDEIELLVIDVAGLDGVFGMNCLVPSLSLYREVDGPGYFERIVIDTANAVMGLDIFDDAFIVQSNPDLDGDGDVDADDAAILAADMTGPTPLLVVEAEHCGVNTEGSGTADGWSWVEQTGGGSIGDGYLQALPDTGLLVGGSGVIESDSPRLTYPIYLPEAGAYFLWLKGAADDGGDDSVYYGLDGVVTNTLAGEAARLPIGSEFGWLSQRGDGERLVIDVPSAGVHTVDLWLREDGAKIDRLALTASETYVPAEPPETRHVADLDGDGDVDMVDFSILAEAFTGP